MLDVEISRDVVKTCIRLVGGLTTGDHIRLQDKLTDLRIKLNPQLNQLRVRITEMVGNLEPSFNLDVGFLRSIDTSTKVREVIDIVATNSERNLG